MFGQSDLHRFPPQSLHVLCRDPLLPRHHTVLPRQDLRIWRLAKRLTVSQLSILSTFFKTTVQGGYKPFYYYDPNMPIPGHQIGSNYDATGISTQGRYTVFFRGSWSQSLTLGRTNVPGLTLVEVA